VKSHHLPALDSVLCYFEFGGDGCPLLFIHGLGCASSFDFPPVVATPRLRGRHAVLVDLLGSGYSDHPDNFSYRIRSHAETILHFIRKKGFKRTVLVGHSMGGAVAIEVATSLKTDIQGLILLEPNLDSGGGLFSKAAASSSESEYVAEGHLDSILEAESSGNEAWATTMRSSHPPGVHRAAASLVEGGSPSWRQQLEALTVPRTVIYGDRSLPDPDVGQLPEHGIATLVVQDAGHAIAIDSPDGLAKAIDEALVDNGS